MVVCRMVIDIYVYILSEVLVDFFFFFFFF